MELLKLKRGARLEIPEKISDELGFEKGDRFLVAGEEGRIVLVPNGVNQKRKQEESGKSVLVRVPKAVLEDSGIKAGDLLQIIPGEGKIEFIAIDKKSYRETKEVKELDIKSRNDRLKKQGFIIKGLAIAAGVAGAITLVSFLSRSSEDEDDENDCCEIPEGKYVVRMYDAETGDELETMDEVFMSFEEAEEYCDVCLADYSTGAEVLELAGEDFADPGSVDFFAEEME